MQQLDQENTGVDLTSLAAVLTHTPDVNDPRLCIARVEFGDGTKNLDGSGGVFQLQVEVGGVPLQPAPQTVTFGPVARTAVFTFAFPVPAGAAVVIKAQSPNAADTDVDVSATLYDAAVGGESTAFTNAALAQLAGITMRVSQPFRGPGVPLELVQGDDYAHADGRAIDVTVAGLDTALDLTGAAGHLTLRLGAASITFTATDVSWAADDVVLRFEPSAAQTSGLRVSKNWQYDVQLTPASGRKITPIAEAEAHVLASFSE